MIYPTESQNSTVKSSFFHGEHQFSQSFPSVSLEVVDHHGTAQDVARGLEDEGMGMGLGDIMG